MQNDNRLAIEAIAEAEKADPDILGGQITLWNIVPSVENSLTPKSQVAKQ